MTGNQYGTRIDDHKVSVVIPTLNASHELPHLIGLLKSQTLPAFEILVIDSSSDDDTFEIAEQTDGVLSRRIKRSDFNHGTTRHEAFMQTRGEFVCFLTQDAVPADGHYLENLIRPFRDPGVALVSGRQLPKSDARRFEQLVRLYNYPDASLIRSKKDIGRYGIKTFFASDVCSAYRRSAYLECGGFERVLTNEDMLIAARLINLGYKIAYSAEAQVYHSHNLSLRDQYQRNKAIGEFLETHSDAFLGVRATDEGVRFARKITIELLREHNYSEAFAFCLDCGARFFGSRAGKKLANKARQF